MIELAAATVHFPYMTARPDAAPVADRDATTAGFKRLGRALTDARIETLIVFTSEHIVNLQPRMAPPFIVGTGADHAAFPEPQFNLAPISRRGDPELALELVRALYGAGIDVAHSCELRLDHGTTLPLTRLGVGPEVALIPIIVNTIFPPLPPLARCRALGEAIAQALGESPLDRRVALLATGGISHSVGEPDIERNDSAFDADFLEAVLSGDLDRACAYPDTVLDAAGNGTHEIRNWVAVAAAMHPRTPTTVTSIAFTPGWDSGVHQVVWEQA